jgi:hypothetical protein
MDFSEELSTADKMVGTSLTVIAACLIFMAITCTANLL